MFHARRFWAARAPCPADASLQGIGFSHGDKASFSGPGHFNDPDMLIVGMLGWSGHPRPTNLSKNEQILHIAHWAMLAAPLLLGCDMNQLDDFTFDLLTNDEVLAVDQDELVKQGERKSAEAKTAAVTVSPCLSLITFERRCRFLKSSVRASDRNDPEKS